jgi:hypothetical protein
VHGDLFHCFPSDSILARDLFGERIFINPPPWELADEIGQHFETCRRTALQSTIAIFVLPKWAKFKRLIANWKWYEKFSTRVHLLARHSTQVLRFKITPTHDITPMEDLYVP